MRVANLSHDESIQQNLNGWCLEVGSDYEKYSIKAANKFIEYIGKKPVIDLGSGDGAGTNVFVANGNPTIAVDINPQKLNRIKGATLVNRDFVTYLNKPVENIFMHHSLEHYIDPNKVLKLIGKHLKPGRFCYIAVPKEDHTYSVHHAAFESVEELYAPGLTVIDSGFDQDPNWPQFYVILKKESA